MKVFVDLYEILEISPNANSGTLERMFRYLAQRPSYSALGRGRANLLPPLACAIGRFLSMRAAPPELDDLCHVAQTRQAGTATQRQAGWAR